jgi:hypothetical protein
MTAGPEAVVLVEGYDDRDFWRGLLLRLGCQARVRAPTEHHGASPAFTFETPSKGLVRVLPYNQAANAGIPKGTELSEIVKLKLKERGHKPMRRLVISPDADTHPTLEAARQSVRRLVKGASGDAEETDEGDFLIDKGGLVVSTLFVHADAVRDGEGRLPPGVPAQPALEQLACAALSRVYRERAEAVGTWLFARPSPVGKDHKAHAWSFYAGWSTGHGTGDFYGSLWRDEAVGPALEDLLRKQGAWRVIEALLQP